MKLVNLKIALMNYDGFYYDVASRFGHGGSWLSLVIRGEKRLSTADQLKMAHILGRPVAMLFPEENEIVGVTS